MTIKLPNLGEGIDQGEVASIFVEVGDSIQEGQTILEIESEKTVVSIPADASGKVSAIEIKQGDTIRVGQVLMTLDVEDSSGETNDERQNRNKKNTSSSEEIDSGSGKVDNESFKRDPDRSESTRDDQQTVPVASPTVRLICSQLGIDPLQIPTRSRAGRIELQDLSAYVQDALASAVSHISNESKQRDPSANLEQWGSIHSKPLSKWRKVIGRRMLESSQSIPHVTQFDWVDATDVEAIRTKHSGEWKKHGTPLTHTVFAIHALAHTLKEHPKFRAVLSEDGEEIIDRDYCHISIATETDRGLAIPVIRDAERKSFAELAFAVAENSKRARAFELKPEDTKGGVITISNQGGIGGGHFTPIINTPECAILGLGRTTIQPAMFDGRIEPRARLPVSLSYDHRLIDGADAIRFLNSFVKCFEEIEEDTVLASFPLTL